VPFILSERSSRMAYPGSPRNLLRRFVGSKATAIAANSEQGASYWHQQGFQGISVVIRNSIPFEEIRQVKPCSVLPVGSGLSLSIDQQLMLYAGRYGAEKNLEVLLESLSLALGRCRNSVAALFGAGPMQERMETIHASLANRERIFILGYTKDLWAYMRRAQLFVSLSLFEGNPNVVLEAVAAGCPLVLSDIPAHREILDEKSARLVPATNAHAVAGAIHELLTTSEKAAALAEHARGRISNWCVQGAAREYMDLYNQVLRNREWTHKK
jgi:glycosyltransferase involved in cell wall biosynthesis